MRTVLTGIRRTHRVRPDRGEPVRAADLVAAFDPSSPRDARDRALILIGCAGALRRSELAALTLEDLVVDGDGLRVLIAASKTDPTGSGHTRGLSYGTHPESCPVRAWQAWLRHHCGGPVDPSSDGEAGSGSEVSVETDAEPSEPSTRAGDPVPAFVPINRWGHLGVNAISDRAIAQIIGNRAAAAELSGHWAGHSLRRGCATTAYRSGTAEVSLVRHGRWRSTSAMRGYIDEGTVWIDNPTRRLGL